MNSLLKKVMIFAIAAILTVLCSFMVFAEEPGAVSPDALGDVNNDNSVNAADALEVLKTAAAINETSIDVYRKQDINLDFSINAEDALSILKYSAKIEGITAKGEVVTVKDSDIKELDADEEIIAKYNDFYENKLVRVLGESSGELEERAIQPYYTLSPEFLAGFENIDPEILNENTRFYLYNLISIADKPYICLVEDSFSDLTRIFIFGLSEDAVDFDYSYALKKNTYVAIFKDSENKLVKDTAAVADLAQVIRVGSFAYMVASYSTYEAEYPIMEQYAQESWDGNNEQYYAWLDSKAELNKGFGQEEKDALLGFSEKSMRLLLSESGEENVIYSPLNVYMALSMIAEISDGESRQQILELIGAEDIEELREEAMATWRAHYRNDGTVESVLANSIWLRDDMDYNADTLKTLSDTYYASSFRGEMGSFGYNKELQDWLNEQTKGLLQDEVSDIEMNPETLLATASTIYFRGKWDGGFSERLTKEDIFHSVNGDVVCDFMNKSESIGDYYWGDKFTAIAEEITYGGNMWFILPDEGVTVDNLLGEEELMEFIKADGNWENKVEIKRNISVPKFDVSSELKLEDTLPELGVTDIFDSNVADFSALFSEDIETEISSMKHCARVKIDEEGCEATAFTVTTWPGAALPPEYEIIDFVADRPFIFVITSDRGVPLFMGVVNNPS